MAHAITITTTVTEAISHVLSMIAVDIFYAYACGGLAVGGCGAALTQLRWRDVASTMAQQRGLLGRATQPVDVGARGVLTREFSGRNVA